LRKRKRDILNLEDHIENIIDELSKRIVVNTIKVEKDDAYIYIYVYLCFVVVIFIIMTIAIGTRYIP
jgi:hypothetical protein